MRRNTKRKSRKVAVDINADTTKSSSEEVYNWLAQNAYKYGLKPGSPELGAVCNRPIPGFFVSGRKKD